MNQTWWILRDETTGPNGRTYRQTEDGGLECHVAGAGWLPSYFETFARLKRYVLREDTRKLYIKDREMREFDKR